MAAVLFITFWLAASVVSIALMIVHMRRTVDERRAGTNRRDSEVDRRRAQAEADVEEHDVDDMLDAISEYRRRAGRRDLGEELAGELLRSTGSTDADGARAASLDVVVEHSGAPNSPKPVRRRTGCASMGHLDIVRETAGTPSDDERQSAAVDLERIQRGRGV
ncbi:MAG TPA: hypothetical protein VFI54_24495 [Solirubrobacteraceae bacterium]|nr:hypothetical protein [Solirubrobacteraceae bacterium]